MVGKRLWGEEERASARRSGREPRESTGGKKDETRRRQSRRSAGRGHLAAMGGNVANGTEQREVYQLQITERGVAETFDQYVRVSGRGGLEGGLMGA